MRKVWLVSLAMAALTAAACGRGSGGGGGAGGGGTAGTGAAGGGGAGGAGGEAMVTECPIDQAINPMATQPAACQPGEKCDIFAFTEASGMIDPTMMIPTGCIDANMDSTPDGTCEFVFGCVPAGMAMTGTACMVDMMTGADNCEPGDACTNATATSGATAKLMCMELCPAMNGDGSCSHLATAKGLPASATHCFRGGFFRGTNVSACTVPCQLGDNSCPTGYGCKILISQQEFMCWGVGTVAVGSSCMGMGTNACGAEASCSRNNADDPNSPAFCRANCSATKMCASGFTCRAIAGIRDGGGTCQPM